MNTETTNHDALDAEVEKPPVKFSDTQILAGGLAVLGGVLLLRFGAVRSLLKAGLVGGAAWATYNHAEKSGWFEPARHAESGGDHEETPLAEASQRLAEAWGAQYRGPASGVDGVDGSAGPQNPPPGA